MTFRALIRALLRSRIVETELVAVVDDLTNNGLSAADDIVIAAYLDQIAP